MNTFKDYFNSVNASQIHENDAKLGIDKLAELSDFLSKGNVKTFTVTCCRHDIDPEVGYDLMTPCLVLMS